MMAGFQRLFFLGNLPILKSLVSCITQHSEFGKPFEGSNPNGITKRPTCANLRFKAII